MRKWMNINGYKIKLTKIVAICPIKELEGKFFIEVYFSGEFLSIRMPSEEEALKAHSRLTHKFYGES